MELKRIGGLNHQFVRITARRFVDVFSGGTTMTIKQTLGAHLIVAARVVLRSVIGDARTLGRGATYPTGPKQHFK